MREFLIFLKCILWHRGHEYKWVQKWPKEHPDIIVKTCQRCGHEPECTVARTIKAEVGITYFSSD